MRILVTGGAGYIGSHATLRLLRDGHEVLVIDNLSRGHAGALGAVRRSVANAEARLTFAKIDLLDEAALVPAVSAFDPDAVLHFAALAYVGESVASPLEYWRVNVAGGVSLLRACAASRGGAGVPRFVFSSTTATYGQPAPHEVPIVETMAQSPINPYGASKLAMERVLRDHAAACSAAGREFSCAFLRYFNVAGCDRAGVLGEHHAPETHLIPTLIQAALGIREHFRGENVVTLYGSDYPTPDGTAIRDYIHVEDLVDAHVRVLAAMSPGRVLAYNLGRGRGSSVKEVVASVERVLGRSVPVKMGPRRAGDPAELTADASLIARELGWSPRVADLDDIVASACSWFAAHRRGYDV